MKPEHPIATAIARMLRAEASSPERKLWRALRGSRPGHQWRRQVPLGCFADCALHGRRLVIEVDGEHHAAREQQDRLRQPAIEREGCKLLRFTAGDGMGSTEGVLTRIGLEPQDTPTPTPPHKEEGLLRPPPWEEGRGWQF